MGGEIGDASGFQRNQLEGEERGEERTERNIKHSRSVVLVHKSTLRFFGIASEICRSYKLDKRERDLGIPVDTKGTLEILKGGRQS